jgi:hypothetical protein
VGIIDAFTFIKELDSRIEFWRTRTDDPHNISVAVYVALTEVRDAVLKAEGPSYPDQNWKKELPPITK